MASRQRPSCANAQAYALIVGAAGDERSTIAEVLAGQNIVPATADEAEHAIETLSDSPVDIVVSDIALKGRPTASVWRSGSCSINPRRPSSCWRTPFPGFPPIRLSRPYRC
jgi:hypothetical protein